MSYTLAMVRARQLPARLSEKAWASEQQNLSHRKSARDIVMALTALKFLCQMWGSRAARIASTLGRWGKHKRASTSPRQLGKPASSAQPQQCGCQ